MRRVSLFVEDAAHEKFIGAVLKRVAHEHKINIKITFSSVRGGHGTVKRELKQFINDILRDRTGPPDLIIVATDANCMGFNRREKEITAITNKVTLRIICAIPEPHIERWFLIDSLAFKKAAGKGCGAPDKKCERSRYKNLLIQNIVDAGIIPSFGGIEFADAIVEEMDLPGAARFDHSFERFISELRAVFREW